MYLTGSSRDKGSFHMVCASIVMQGLYLAPWGGSRGVSRLHFLTEIIFRQKL